ncbi:uncharacterized protein [Centruroides vittatus]|uniref:uncharacterized protein n=1 Tax=Centruroides vittatus TaxID=120091 RepID=UPI00350EB8BA
MPSRLEQMQLQLRQKLMQEKEEKLIKIYNNNQEKVLSKLSRSNELPRKDRESLKTSPVTRVPEKTFPVSVTSSSRNLPVKKGSPGVDRSRPLVPIRKANLGGGHGSVGGTSSTVHNGTGPLDSTKKNAKSRASVEEYKRMRAEVKRKELDLVTKIKDQQGKPNGTVQETKNIEKLAKLNIGRTSPIRSVAKENTFGSNKHVSSSHPVNNKNKNIRSNGTASVKPSTAPPPNTVNCSLCGRHFAKDRIEKHEVICQKINQKKRKVFDACKMRVKGTEAESFVRKGISVKEEPVKKKSNWRTKHESFLESIREAKRVQKHLAAGGKISDLPPPKPSENPDYVQCPYCNRKFNEAAADRHIPKCKNIVSNKPRRK